MMKKILKLFAVGSILIAIFAWKHESFDTKTLVDFLAENNLQGAVIEELHKNNTGSVYYLNSSGNKTLLFEVPLFSSCNAISSCRSGYESSTLSTRSGFVGISPDRSLVFATGQGLGMTNQESGAKAKHLSDEPEFFDLTTLAKISKNQFWERLRIHPYALGDFIHGLLGVLASPDGQFYITRSTNGQSTVLARIDENKQFNTNYGEGMFGYKEKDEGEPVIFPYSGRVTEAIWFGDKIYIVSQDDELWVYDVGTHKSVSLIPLPIKRFLMDIVSPTKFVLGSYSKDSATYVWDISDKSAETKLLSKNIKLIGLIR